MKTIGIITNAGPDSGVGSRAHQLFRHMGKHENSQLSLVMLDGKNNLLGEVGWGAEMNSNKPKQIMRLPGFLNSKSISWVRLAKHISEFDVYDISNQTLSFIAKKRRPSIVTVHDIIELTNPQDKKAYLFNKYLLSGIVHADNIVAVSEFTKKSIQEYFSITESRITVIPNGVDDGFHQIPDFASSVAYQQLKQEYIITDRSPIILCVGSEHPRKNMQTVLQTVALIKKQFPNVLLMKVGEPGILSGRQKTLELIDTLDLKSNVLLLGNISRDRLNELYNIVDALLYPSYLEGFGLPPLQALAAGCIVACSNATSLPEVVGDAAITLGPDDAEGFAQNITRSMQDVDFKSNLVRRGLEQAKKFSWKSSAEKMFEVYRSI
ncbi:MAG: glycosyltransferase family 1 protein [Patescibacteria group bacterium]